MRTTDEARFINPPPTTVEVTSSPTAGVSDERVAMRPPPRLAELFSQPGDAGASLLGTKMQTGSLRPAEREAQRRPVADTALVGRLRASRVYRGASAECHWTLTAGDEPLHQFL